MTQRPNTRLVDWQNALVSAIVDDEVSAVHDMVSQPERVDVYQRNARHGLVGVLKLNYEHCCHVLGEAYFEALAMRFVCDHFPEENSLNCYDDRFVAFIEQHAAQDDSLESMPYLTDLARLDDAMTRCGHASADDPNALSVFSQLPPEQQMNVDISLGSGVCVLTSEWPLADIVRLNQGAIEQLALNDADELGHYYVTQRDAGVVVHALSHDEAEVLLAAANGVTLGALIESCADAVAFLLESIQQGVLVIAVPSD